jgi:putative toxin-antitoxin system antitoxin component (TIGR02293 family)
MGEDVIRIRFPGDKRDETYVIDNIDDLLRLRISREVKQPISRLMTAMLISKQPASGETLKFISATIPKDVVAASLEINPTNLSKLYRRQALSRTQTEELDSLTQVWKDALYGLFQGDEDTMIRWLETPVPALNGTTPRSLMGTLSGRRVLEGYIQDLRYGDYS